MSCRLLLVICVFLQLSGVAYAQDDQWILDGGLGVFHSASQNGLSETKMLSLGVQEDLYGPIKQRGTLGGWIDNGGSGRNGSGFASAQIGFEVVNNGLVGSVFTGPSLITTPDVLLGGMFQFTDDLHLGIQDNQLNYIGLLYRHLSSAGLETPNSGRDFIGLELRMPFN